MKIKKILTAFLAAVTVTGTMTVTCFAANNATYCFDTADKISDWQTYGSTDETGFKIAQTTRQSKNGDGSMVVSEDVSEELSDGYGGAFISADALGLEDFRGCTVSMSILLSENAENHHENIVLYSDGIIWLQTVPTELSSSSWTDVVLTIPEDASNSKIGFTIPTFDIYSGDVLYIDDFSVVNAEGNQIANLGDYKAKTILSTDTVPSWVNIVLTVVLVLLILVIVGGIGMLVSSGMKKFH